MDRDAYRRELADLRRALASLAGTRPAMIVVEGRDAAGKTGAIRRLVKGLAPGTYRVVRLGPPDRGAPYFVRWWNEVPRDGELVVCDRSWYNRAALEPIMGYCSAAEAAAFLAELPAFEARVAAAATLVKILLEISPAEQARRLARRTAPTAIDAAALAHYDDYTRAYAAHAWVRIATDDKRAARLALFREVIARLATS